MKIANVSSWSALFVLVLSTAVVADSNFYTFETVAKTGDLINVNGVDTQLTTALTPSINQSGRVAFRCADAQFNSFVCDSGESGVDPKIVASFSGISLGVQINDSGQVVARRSNSGSSFIYRFDVSDETEFEIIADGRFGAGFAVDFDSVFSHVSMNNSGEIVFSALTEHSSVTDCVDTCLATRMPGIFDSFNSMPLNTPARPMIADDGSIVVRNGNLASDPIVVYNYELDEQTTISTGFTEVTQSPGITDDGNIVAFVGNNGSGMQLYIAVQDNGGWQLFSILGDATKPELGFSDDGTPIYFAGLDLSSRVAVIRQEFPPAGLDADTVVVSFVGTPSASMLFGSLSHESFYPGHFFSQQEGLWTVRIDLSRSPDTGELVISSQVPLPIVQIGDAVPGDESDLVEVINIYDPIASYVPPGGTSFSEQVRGANQIAFVVTSGTNYHLIRAKHGYSCLLRVERFSQGAGAGNLALWRDDLYADSPTEMIREKGCALSSIAMSLNFAANKFDVLYDTNPGILNLSLTNASAFNDSNNIIWGKSVPTQLPAGSNIKFRYNVIKTKSDAGAFEPEARDYLISQVCNLGVPVVVSNATSSHFFLVSGVVNDRFLISDPGSRSKVFLDTEYDDDVKTRGSVQDPTDVSSISITASPNVEILIVDSLGRRTGLINGVEIQEIPDFFYFEDGIDDDETGVADLAPTPIIGGNLPPPDLYDLQISSKDGTPFVVTVFVSDVDGEFSLDERVADEIPAGEVLTLTLDIKTGAGQVSGISTAGPTFADVPEDYWAYAFIETLAASQITAGCGNGNYCPADPVTRAQMAVFLERGINGSGFSPPAATGNVFSDVGAGDFAAGFIEQLFADGITAGCGNGNYCPGADVTRDQMAVFLLRAKYGSSYSPPSAAGVFGDVDLNYWAVAWIEQLAAEGITAGCGGGNYCPGAQVTRDQMAVFLVRTFGL